MEDNKFCLFLKIIEIQLYICKLPFQYLRIQQNKACSCLTEVKDSSIFQ